MQECFDLIQERPTLSRTLLSFESETVTLSELRRARQHSVRPPEPPDATDAWVPSAERERSKATLREQWLRSGLSGLRTRADAVYRRVVAEVGAAH